MLIELIAQYKDIISSWEVEKYELEGPDFRLKLKIFFVDGSILHVRQVVFNGTTLKYAYHWQAKDGSLKMRWDNAQHWPDISTFPHHKHVARDAHIVVLPSSGADLSVVMEEIAMEIRSDDRTGI